MKQLKLTLAAFIIMMTAAISIKAQDVQVGGEPMKAKKDIIESAVNSKAHTILVAAVKAADLVATLKTAGPFTVFAPTNDAFENLPAGTVDNLLKSENKATLTKVLTYQVVAGKYTHAELVKLITKGNGKATLPTVSGGKLIFTMNGTVNILITDETGGTANINVYDVMQSNGGIRSIDAIVMPK